MKFIMLAQVDIEWWHIALALLTVFLVKGFEWFKEYLTDRRARANDEQQTQFLDRVAKSSESTNVSMAKLCERLQGDRDLDKEHHRELLDKIEGSCKCLHRSSD